MINNWYNIKINKATNDDFDNPNAELSVDGVVKNCVAVSFVVGPPFIL